MKRLERCSICKKEFYGLGNNAQPITDGRCCDLCNFKFVIPKRIESFKFNSPNQR